MLEISDFYLDGKSCEFEVDTVWAFKRYISEKWENDDFFTYSLWGITQITEEIFEWIREYYPNAKLEYVFDGNSHLNFHGIKARNIDYLADKEYENVIFVTAGAINPIAKKIFNQYKITKYVVCYGNLYIVDGVEKSY